MPTSNTKKTGHWIAGGLAGVGSAALFFLLIGGVPLAPLLTFFMPLPLFLVGLSAGSSLAAVGTLVLAVTSGAATSPLLGLMLGALVGLPAVGLTYLALLNRLVNTPDGGQIVEWYPAGRLLTWLTGFAALVCLLVALGAQISASGDLKAGTQQMVVALHGGEEQIAEVLAAMKSSLSVEDYIALMALLIPPALGANLSLMAGANAGLAQRFLVRAGRAIRPSPAVLTMTLPEGLVLALAASVALSLLPGDLGLIGGSLAIIFLIPYFLLGLVVVHAISTAWSARGVVLTVFYLFLVLLSGFVLVVALLGIAEHWFHIRRKFGAQGGVGSNPGGE